jgi:hypothetical protein
MTSKTTALRAIFDLEDRDWRYRQSALRSTLSAVLDAYSAEDQADAMLQLLIDLGRSGHGYSLEVMIGTLEEGRDLEAGL